MTHSAHWRQIVRQYVCTLPSGSVFRSRDVFDWVERKVAIDVLDLMPPNRPAWRSRLSRALQALANDGVIIHATEHPRCQTFFVP